MEYTLFKLIHVIAVMLFMGNIITGLFWMHFAMQTKDPRIVHFTIKGIIKSDRYFTLPGVALITVFGLLAAMQGQFPVMRTGWILWSIVMFSISGLAFGVKVAPLQRKMRSLTVDEKVPADFNWDGFRKFYTSWHIWGGVAVLTPLAAMVMMTLKLPQ